MHLIGGIAGSWDPRRGPCTSLHLLHLQHPKPPHFKVPCLGCRQSSKAPQNHSYSMLIAARTHSTAPNLPAPQQLKDTWKRHDCRHPLQAENVFLKTDPFRGPRVQAKVRAQGVPDSSTLRCPRFEMRPGQLAPLLFVSLWACHHSHGVACWGVWGFHSCLLHQDIAVFLSPFLSCLSLPFSATFSLPLPLAFSFAFSSLLPHTNNPPLSCSSAALAMHV